MIKQGEGVLQINVMYEVLQYQQREYTHLMSAAFLAFLAIRGEHELTRCVIGGRLLAGEDIPCGKCKASRASSAPIKAGNAVQPC